VRTPSWRVDFSGALHRDFRRNGRETAAQGARRILRSRLSPWSIVTAALLACVAGSTLAAAGCSTGPDENFSGFDPGMTYEQTQVDRELPNVKDPVVLPPKTQVAGPAMSFGSSEATGTGPWANDENFIALPQ
jgi:hypothetical protein